MYLYVKTPLHTPIQTLSVSFEHDLDLDANLDLSHVLQLAG